MLNEMLLGGVAAVFSGTVGFLISKRISSANFNIYVEQAKAKAKAIENEAETMLQRSTIRSKEIEFEAKKSYDEAVDKAKRELLGREENIAKLEQEFKTFQKKERESLKDARKRIEGERVSFKQREKALDKCVLDYEGRVDEVTRIVESQAGLTRDEAKIILMQKVEEQSRADIAHVVRRMEEDAKKDAKRNANYILSQATSRFAGEFASERLVNTVHLDDDELKGRIIGKEGRNIKTLEMLLGVDIIIDETPKTITVSSFNLYRRAIATKTLELLIEDGRIQPARIEEIYEKVTDEFEESMQREGEDVIFDLGLSNIHPELIKMVGRLRYRASYGQNALAHTLEVAHLAGIMAAEMGGNPLLARRAGLLHDIGKALTHDKQGNHIDLGAEICNQYNEDSVVINAIYAHHGHQEILSIECGAVCAADALSAARPGARREVLESFVKRVSEIEEIASQKTGVRQAYAVNAGREVRVIVNAVLINDDETIVLAREIAKEIEDKMQYPGEIKVNVIRESRAIEYAK
ncbi:MAG: ribonuclease Y [Campylobacterota bacterium]|nr:ribonuclease Y [Campylobacterota bacterium]